MQTGKNHKIEEILSSLDAVKKAEAPDFFYTRLKARLEKGVVPAQLRPWILRPVFAAAALVFILLVNAFVIINRGSSSGPVSTSNDLESIQSIAAEYSVADAGSMYDLNSDR